MEGRIPVDLAALQDVKVIFVGNVENWAALNDEASSRSKVERIFTVRWPLVFRWLRVLCALNPHYRYIHIVEAIPSDMQTRTVASL